MLVRLKDNLNEYHQQLADIDGWLWVVLKVDDIISSLYEARSVATGMVYMLDADYTEKLPDAVQEPKT